METRAVIELRGIERDEHAAGSGRGGTARVEQVARAVVKADKADAVVAASAGHRAFKPETLGDGCRNSAAAGIVDRRNRTRGFGASDKAATHDLCAATTKVVELPPMKAGMRTRKMASSSSPASISVLMKFCE